MATELKLAFVGCGGIAAKHLVGLREAGSIRLTAVVDPVRERAQEYAAETGADVFTSLEDALAHGDFDAVDLMLPHDLHEALTLQAFEAGKHVLLEKPMATTLDGCERILTAARESGTVFMVAENAQYWPELVAARDLINGGRIGDIVSAHTNYVLNPTQLPSVAKEPWRMEKMRMGGGIVIDGGSHWLRPMRMWMGEVVEVVASLAYPYAAMQGESLAHALLRFESGKTATFIGLRHTVLNEPDPWWRITGSSGEIIIDHGCRRGVMLFDPAHPDGEQILARQGYDESFAPELVDFRNAIVDGTPLAASPEYALGELRIALAMYRSAQTGQWERVWD